MAWTDRPTSAQIGAWAHLVRWEVPSELANAACKFLEENATRRQVSDELGRARDLYMKRKLNKDSCFAGPLWDGFRSKQ